MSSLPPALNFAKAEEEICKKWKVEDSFHQQDKLSEERGDEEFVFFDGPPFATGLPHYGHILAGTIKDTVTRYAAMTGKRVERRAGWDCHGLPVEQEIDKMLNIKFRDQVLDMGIDKYNTTCRGIVTRYTKEWESTITRLGRWIDFENDYKTMDLPFMESVWWVFSQLWEKKMVYQGFKVMPYSTGCATVLSNSEAGSNYKDVSDPAVTVSFPIVDDDEMKGVSFIAWTTTPWTLPSNLALCVNPKLEYVQILDKKSNNRYIMAKARLCQIYPIMNNKKKWKPKMADELYEVEKTMLGADLKGKRYQPLFDYFAGPSTYFQVVSDPYVTDDAGTGVVHQAPAFGEDDFRVCLANGIIEKGDDSFPCPVDADGLFTDDIIIAKGVYVKDADSILIADIKERGRLVQKDSLVHSYPFCWRSETPLIYKAVTSWFVKVEEIRDQIVENNKNILWVPSHVGEVRFNNWLEGARDWAISRSRFWGTPLPIWANEDFSETICVGSIAQLEELTGTKVTDLHREFIDDLEIPSQKNPDGPPLKRVDEVFDCWFESGSMPYAQKHYPFENKESFENGFPADFIAEGLDQTRGWFYSLMILSTALFGKQAMNNVIVNGLVLAKDGKKMSKSLKNYPDPTIVINKYGADALRMYLINSPVVRAEELKFKEEGVLGVVKEMFLPLYNAFRFFLQNMERRTETGLKFVPSLDMVKSTTNSTDIWISAATQELIKFVHEEMTAYRLYTVLPALVTYVTQLTNWYVRLNRDRLKGLEGKGSDADREAETSLQVLYDVLLDVTIILGPFTPFLAEFFYQHLRKLQPSYAEAVEGGGSTNPVMPGKSDSVHFLKLPEYDDSRLNHDAVEAMGVLQTIVEQGRNARQNRLINMRTPVKSVVAILRKPSDNIVNALTGPLEKYILSELNAWEFKVIPEEEQHDWVTLSMTPNFPVLGKKVGKKMKAITTAVKKMSHSEAVKCLEEGKLVVGDVELDTLTELISKLSFSKEGDFWESTPSADGATVVALDTTQDDAIISAGMARELINHIQQLRKAALLDLKDVVEVFFYEEDGVTSTEDAVSKNVTTLDAKFKGSIPLPKRLSPEWSVVLKSDTVDVGGSKVNVSVCRPAIAVSDSLDDIVKKILSTKEPSEFSVGENFKCTVDGKEYELNEGEDFWLSSAAKARSTKSLSWIL
mmetsp:Transcript_49632/g.56127  ORF Transcript_49632/g.56127 Transcript_49632/m.56127 type:complete len:1176 (-) Transcript_49632:78-3605(-)